MISSGNGPWLALPRHEPASVVAGDRARLRRNFAVKVEAMLRDMKSYPFVSDVIHGLAIGRMAFYHHFPNERIRKLRG